MQLTADDRLIPECGWPFRFASFYRCMNMDAFISLSGNDEKQTYVKDEVQ